MRILLFVSFLFLSFVEPLVSQQSFSLAGRIVDVENQPVPYATVMLSPGKKATYSDLKGHFSFSELTRGEVILKVSFVGYKTLIDTILIPFPDTLKLILKESPMTLLEVEIKDEYVEHRQKEDALNVEIVNDLYLKQHLGGSLMESLERIPGVNSLAIGSGASKPIIRGLAFNRVSVIENGIRHESQQWGADHGLEIDQFAVNHVEVVKGPSSLMYGSEAIGGVIIMNNRKIPARNTFGGSLDLAGKTNNNYLGSSLSLYGRKESVFGDFRATWIDYADYKVPVDSVDIYSYRAPLYKHHLRNTAGNELNLHASLGYIRPSWQTTLSLSNVHTQSGFFANAHGLEPRMVDTLLHDQSNRDIQLPFQEVNHFKSILSASKSIGSLRMESDFGFQHNFRQEWSPYVNHGYMPANFPDTLPFEDILERAFDKYVYSFNLRALYDYTEDTHFQTGIQAEYQDNRIDGRGFVIPAYTQQSLGGFLIGRHTFSKRSTLHAGIRYDYGSIHTDAYSDWFLSPEITGNDTTYSYLQRASELQREFPALSWSLGYSFNPENWMLKANLGKSFRMPIAKELAANGVNYHHFSYEVGDPDLNPESSYQLDVLAEYSKSVFALGITPFINYFPNYIFLNPTSEHDRLYGNGNQVFYYTQSEVFRSGLEIHSHIQLFEFLQLGLIGEYVYSLQLSGDKKGFSLPFSPPASLLINLKYQQAKVWKFRELCLSVDFKLAASQHRIVPPEEITPGYQLVNLILHAKLPVKQQFISLSFQIQNIFNTTYYNHTSYYRLINVPEAGRNWVLSMSIPFNLQSKS